MSLIYFLVVGIPMCLIGSYLGELTVRWARKRRGERQIARMIYDVLDTGSVNGDPVKRATITFVIERDPPIPPAPSAGEGEKS